MLQNYALSLKWNNCANEAIMKIITMQKTSVASWFTYTFNSVIHFANFNTSVFSRVVIINNTLELQDTFHYQGSLGAWFCIPVFLLKSLKLFEQVLLAACEPEPKYRSNPASRYPRSVTADLRSSECKPEMNIM